MSIRHIDHVAITVADIEATIAHVRGLAAIDALTADEAESLVAALNTLAELFVDLPLAALGEPGQELRPVPREAFLAKDLADAPG